MEFVDIITAIISIVIVVGVVRYQIVRYKKNTSNTCDGGCSHCQLNSQCASKTKEDENKS